MTYRIFISNELHILNSNISEYVGGKQMSQSYYDVLFPQPEETRSAEEIIEGLKKKLQEI